jgi:sulfate transport system substrate-binding protein
VQRGIGDVLITWENEALLAEERLGQKLGQNPFEIVVPSVSILAEPPVALVDKVVDKRNTRQVAQAYLESLYTPAVQEIAARNHFRPRLDWVAQKYAATFPKVQTFTIDELFGGWSKAQQTHFADGGTFDQIYQPGT